MLETWREKTQGIFSEAFGEKSSRLRGLPLERIEAALRNEIFAQHAHDIAFHMTDWTADAAFLVALALAPDRFTPDEIEDGITACLIHIPNHVAAAATLAGWEMRDVFKVGAKIEPPLPEKK